MSLDSRTSALRDLHDLGLLADAQQLKAVNHPRLTDLVEQPSPQETLAWLLRAEVTNAKDLLYAASGYRAGLDAAALAARRALVVDTLRRINQDSVDALLAEALITQDIHEVVSESLMTDRALLTPAATMALVLEARMLSWADFQALKARPASERSAAANAILAETVTLVDAREREIKRAFWGQVFPGPLWLYIVGVPLVIGAFLWYNLAPSSVPDCDSDVARNGIERSILMNRISSRTKVASLAGLSRDTSGYPSIGGLREVGYNKVRNLRGCMGQMTIDKETEPFAYVIERDPARKNDGFVLRGAEMDIVTARFGKFDANGDFLHKAEPIGRSDLAQAFRAGTAALSVDPASQRAAALMRKITGQKPDEAAEPKRADDVEPTGACHALKPGESYTCPLMAEWSNPLMAMLGQADQEIVHGEFTFERNAAGATPVWRVSENFADEFDRARLATQQKKSSQQDAVATK